MAVDTTYNTYKVVFDVYFVLFLCIFGITGNVVSIVVLGKDRVVRRTTGFLLQVLAFTDLIYLICCLFIQTLNTIHKQTDWAPSLKYHWPYMEPYMWPCASIAQTCTVWLVVVVTADRFVAICKPLHAPQYSTMSRMRKAVIFVWMLSIIYNVPRFFERHVAYKVDNLTNVTYPVTYKTNLRDNKMYVLLYKTFMFFIVRFCVPLSSLAFFNTRLIQAIRESYRQRREMPGDCSSQRREKYSLTLVVVVVVFIFCETPDFFLRAWMTLSKFFPSVPFPRRELRYVNVISNLFLTINSCSNFVIYCFIGTRFRKILLEMLGKKKSSNQPRCSNTQTNTNNTHETHTQPHTHLTTHTHSHTYRFSSQWEREEMTILVPKLQ